MAKDVAQARIAVVGAGLMGHGIAQVFALAGHEVTITDTVMKNLDTVTNAHRRQLARPRRRPAGDRAGAAVPRPRRGSARGRLRRRGDLGRFAAQAEAVRRDRTSRAARCDPCQQHVGHSDHLDHGGIEKPRARARHALVEPAVSGAARRSDRDAMDLARGRRLDHGPAPRRPARSRRTSRRTCRASSAIGCSTRCGAKRSRSSKTASAMRRRSMRSSRHRSADGLRCSARWKMPTSSAPI